MSIPPPGPLAYEGQVVVPFINRTFSPNSGNNDFSVPTLWTNTTAKSAFLLTAKPLGVANWLNLGASTSAPLVSLTGNSGGAIFGDSNQNINILGTAGQVTVTGSGNTLTISLVGGGTAVDSFAPDTGTNPVIPTAGGLVSIKGQNPANSSGIRVSGATNELDISMFSPFVGDFAFTSSSSGDTETLTISNSSNTANSSALSQITVAGATAGNPFQTFTVTGGASWSHGIDNSDNDRFKLSASTSLGTTNWFYIETLGNAVFTGDALSVESDLIGDVVQLEVVNDDDTNTSSAARLNILTEATGGDAYMLIGRDTAGAFELGIQNSSDALFLNAGPNATLPNLSGTTVMKVTQSGLMTRPLQSSFLVVLTTSATNVTGNGGGYAFGTQGGGATTTIFDQGSNITSPAGVLTYTATATGRHHFHLNFVTENIDAAMSSISSTIVTTARTFNSGPLNPGAIRDVNNQVAWSQSCYADMTIGDTATFNISISGGGGNTAGIAGSVATSPTSWVEGFLET